MQSPRFSVCMAAWLAVHVLAGFAQAGSPGIGDAVDFATGALRGLSQQDGQRVTTSFRNVYHLMSKSGDAVGTEDEDRVVGHEAHGETNVFRCVNGRLPGLTIEKMYVREGATVRRLTTFASVRDEPVFVRFETEGHFDAAFMEKVWYLGAGYIGPHKPYPHKPVPQEMNWYVQSTKGLVFTNPENGRGAFAHWRVKIDGTPVLPWWHSTINTYREKADRMWFLPDGYKMCLGTSGVTCGKPVTVEDRFDVFNGDIYKFFDLFAAEPAVRDELAAIPSAQPWVGDLLAVVQSGTLDYYRYLSEMEPKLPVFGIQTTMGGWGDCRPTNGAWTGNYGGTILTNEVTEYLSRLKGLSPTIRHCFYQLVISAGERTRVVAEHPDWFRRHDRRGNDDSLFPGDQNNWQTMFSVPAARDFLVSTSSAFADFCGADGIYNDEAQMTNAIDWDRLRVTRDDDVVKYWRALRTRAAADGRALFFNGSGNPYAELNCMESPHELKPDRWRDWVGVAWGIGMMNRLKPGNRTVLLYWRDGLDYVNRVLALGWLPYPAQSVRMYPLDVMRAAYQSGNLWPVSLDYAPDWKRDRWTEIESHAVRRPDRPDTLLSFINRTAAATNVSVRVSLASLGWMKGTPVNVWMLTPRPNPKKGVRYMLSDAEIRENWRDRGLNAGGTFLDKRLVWSGTCDGTFETVLENVAPNDMRQLLFVPGRLAFYALGDRPCDYPYVTDRRGRIEGNAVDASVAADLVLACADRACTCVTVNGKVASCRRISVGGRNMTLVSVPAGRSVVDWREGPVDPSEAPAPDPVRLSGPPSRVAWNRDRLVPARRELTGAQVILPNFKISARGTYHSAWSDFQGLQSGLEPGVAVADAERRTLTVGTSRREGGYDYPVVHTWAGFEICYSKDLRIDYEQTFGTVDSVATGHTGKGWQGQEKNFVGFAVDYRVRGEYVRRVLFRMDGRAGKIDLAEPDWGKRNAAADEVVDLGNVIGGAATGCLHLHLADHAPPDWDGVVFLSAGATRLWPNRRLTLKISPEQTPVGSVTLDPQTGGFAAFGHRFENRYLLMEKGKADVTALEREDVVVGKVDGEGFVAFSCTNPKLPDVTIVKRYSVDRVRGSVRRTLAFKNAAATSKYVTPFTDCTFAEGFKSNLWHLGAGYIGPYKPYPDVKAPLAVNDYKQSSKGLVFIHPENGKANAGSGNLSHYRVKIDDQVVWPWWHSSIGRYREYHDRLFYLPNGYRMGLGTFGLYKDKTVSVTDQFNAFDGDLFTFFDDIFAADREIAAEIASIPAAPRWFADVFCCGFGANEDYALSWLVKMIDEGELMPRHWGSFSWGEYVDELGLRGVQGGHITTDEFAAYMDSLRSYAPARIHPSHYGIVISVSWFARVFKDHPEWFRVHDRNGAVDSLFPGVSDNFQTMFNNPACREWLVEMLVAYCKRLGNEVVYVDESQQTNTIDWDRDQVTLDSDSVKFWKHLTRRFREEGILFWANGSGNPYAQLNYMESPDELAPARWRNWAGVGFGISMMNRLKPGNRTSLLVWRPGNDYANRVVALGWVPHPYAANAVNLPVMRAVYQEGNLFPANVRYTPDWKTDAEIEVESHAMKRADARDVILSFINRGATNDIPVTVDLSTLGFGPEERIAVWKLHYDEWRNSNDIRRILSDGEIKANWRERGILSGARVSDPELVYSGPAKGTFADTVAALGPNKMEQYVITLAAPVFFAADGMPNHAFFTAHRHGVAGGRRVTLEREADLLLADLEYGFSDVTANDKPVATRRIRLNGGLEGTLVHLGKGGWTLDWRQTPRTAEASLGKADLPVVPATPPVTSIPRMRIHIEPEKLEVREVGRTLDQGVRLLRKGVYSSSIPLDIRLQEKLSIVCTDADESRLKLTAGPSRREFNVRSLETFSGFEFDGARQVKLRLSHNYSDATTGNGRNRFKTNNNAGKATEYFAGLTVDYSVGGKYAKRVSMSVAFYHHACVLKGAKWGKNGVADEQLDFGDWIEEPSPKTFSLDLAKFAPKGWDGKAWLSLGTCRFLAGHHLELDVLGFNDMSATDFLVPTVNLDAREMPPPLKSVPLKRKPKSLVALDAAEWRDWAKIGSFWLRAAGRPKAQTRAFVAHDYEYLYVGIDADEPLTPMFAGREAWSNDHLELLVERSDGLIYQVIVAPRSETVYLLNRRREDPKGIVARTAEKPGKGWQAFLAVPLDDLKPNMQLTPVALRLELARIRKAGDEYSTWTPIETGFYERKNYGTVILDYSWTK